ncbi:MAG: hypothetical protein NVS4B11_20700 [Ktedonobacteraceae bacterium]
MKQKVFSSRVDPSPGTTVTSMGSEKDHRGDALFWVLGALVLSVASVMVHLHPGPWPADLHTTVFLQHLHTWPWVSPFLNFISLLNDPIPSLIEMFIWLVALSLFKFFRQGIFIALGTAAADGIDGLLSTIVGRPRPQSPLIHVYIHEPFHSFPSGHTEHDMVYYGFLLYLSMSGPVRRWHYRWVLLPFQLFAVVALLSIGYSRVLEGSHWITDVLGGYLSGALLLYLLIALYRWTGKALARRRERKQHDQGVHPRAVV